MSSPLKVGVMGAGAVGCFVGGRLLAAGADVVFVGRPAVKAELETHGLSTTGLDDRTSRVPPDRLAVGTEPTLLADCDVTLCCVKSAQTAEVAAQLAGALPAGALVVSLQNGVRNAEILRRGAPKLGVLGGIVGFNVVSKPRGAFKQATSGPLVLEASDDARARTLSGALATAGFEIKGATDIRGMQWSKLVLNLNNAIGALSGAPTRQIVLDEGYRRIVSAVVDEALSILGAANIRPVRLGTIHVPLIRYVLRLPTPLVRLAARAQLKIDPEARSSMWQDLDKRRLTEVDALNGEVVRLAESCGRDAPLNRRIVALVHEIEQRREGSPNLPPDALWTALALPRQEG